MNTTSNTQTTSSLPTILTANTYFWNSSSSASGRRSNEARRYAEVENFFLAHGFEKLGEGKFQRDGIVVDFSYSESCNHVYKSLTVTRNGKRSNITAVKKLLGI